jgi:asparagine synthase (glutamine-hydrolysing)
VRFELGRCDTRLALAATCPTQALFESVDHLLPDRTRCPPERKAILRRIGLCCLHPALFDRPKGGFVLPFDRLIRRDLEDNERNPARSAGDSSNRSRPRSRGKNLKGPPRLSTGHLFVADWIT